VPPMAATDGRAKFIRSASTSENRARLSLNLRRKLLQGEAIIACGVEHSVVVWVCV
jgi:hypothetical protein